MIDIKSFAKPKNNSSVNSVKGSSNIGGGSKNSGISTSEITGIVEGMLQGINIANGDNTLAITKNTSNNTISFTINSKTWTFDSTTGNLVYNGTVDVTNANFENITVTKAAHFFQLIIDEIKSTKGQILITAANAKLDKVTVRESDGDIFCYWKATDGSKTIYNQFVADDQVICQTFNVGTSSAATQNKFYWYRVYSVGTETIDGELYNYIHLDPKDKDPNSNAIPAVGDEIALLGNRTNADRQAAIIISAYNNQYLDPTIQAPSIVQYSGINNWNLSTHRLNVISKSYNSFKGNFTTTAGENLENKFMPVFPINAPFYQYDYTMEEPQATNPIRYNGENDIFSTPTFLNAGKYKFRVFINSASLSSSIEIGSYGTTYPSSDLGNYSGIGLTSVLGRTDKTMKVGNATFYEYAATINITANGYYGLNYWENYQIYIPENDEGFETNSSKIEQTNTRITTTVNNINGQISTINQTAENIQLQVDNTNIKIDSGNITLNGNTKVQGDLTISDATNGFTLTNNNNYNTIIKPQSIGEYADYNSGVLYNYIKINSEINTLTVANSKTSQYKPDNKEYFVITYNNNNNNNKVYLEAGEVLTFLNAKKFWMNIVGFTAYNRGGYINYVFQGDSTPSTTDFDPHMDFNGVKQQTDGYISYHKLFQHHIYSVNARISIYNSSGTEVGYTTFTGNSATLSYSFTASSTGTYYIGVKLKIRFNNLINNDDYNGVRRRMDYVYRDYTSTEFTLETSKSRSIKQIENKIGYDGISLSLTEDKIVYIGKDSTHIKYGKNEIMVDSDGIKKYAGNTAAHYANEGISADTQPSRYVSEYAPLNGCVVRRLDTSGTFYLQPRDEVIINCSNTGNTNFFVGDPNANIGRKIYFKNIHNGMMYLRKTTNEESVFIRSADRTAIGRIEVNDRGLMLISVGNFWLVYTSY